MFLRNTPDDNFQKVITFKVNDGPYSRVQALDGTREVGKITYVGATGCWVENK